MDYQGGRDEVVISRGSGVGENGLRNEELGV